MPPQALDPGLPKLERLRAISTWLASSWEHTPAAPGLGVINSPWDPETVLAWAPGQCGHNGLRPTANWHLLRRRIRQRRPGHRRTRPLCHLRGQARKGRRPLHRRVLAGRAPKMGHGRPQLRRLLPPRRRSPLRQTSFRCSALISKTSPSAVSAPSPNAPISVSTAGSTATNAALAHSNSARSGTAPISSRAPATSARPHTAAAGLTPRPVSSGRSETRTCLAHVPPLRIKGLLQRPARMGRLSHPMPLRLTTKWSTRKTVTIILLLDGLPNRLVHTVRR